MQQEVGKGQEGPLSAARLRSYLGALLVAYGALGVATHMRLPALLWAGLGGWLGGQSGQDAPPALPGMGLLQSHYDPLPWLPWAAWLAGAALLAWLHTPTPEGRSQRFTLLSGAVSRWAAAAALLALLLVGGYVRLSVLWPQSAGISQLPYDDEGVYAAASQLLLQGILPYRDYFFAHPPVAAFSYAPALAYHFNEWGSPTSFVLARYLGVAYSLLTLGFIFGIGWRLAGVAGGAAAGGLWALDGRVVEINRKVMLDGPMVLFACAALFLYLLARPALAGSGWDKRRAGLMLGLAGASAALSALTKIAGIACLAAIVADMLWMRLEAQGRKEGGGGRLSFGGQVGALAGGALAAALVVAGPFLAAAPSQMVRDVLLFQMLRPSDGIIEVPARIANLSMNLTNSLTLLWAALGFAALSLWVWWRKSAGAWRVIVLWTFFSVLLFTYSRSFYQHYYIQLAAPLCLLGGGLGLLPALLSARDAGSRRSWSPALRWLAPALLLIAALPLLYTEWRSDLERRPNRTFEVVARYVTDAIPPGTPALTTDVQFNFLAARPPSRNGTGYWVDPYGHMIATSLGLRTREWGDLWAAALRGEHSNDVYAVIQRAPAQQDLLDRASQVPLIVVQRKGYSWLTPETVAAIESRTFKAEEETGYTIYRVRESLR